MYHVYVYKFYFILQHDDISERYIYTPPVHFTERIHLVNVSFDNRSSQLLIDVFMLYKFFEINYSDHHYELTYMPTSEFLEDRSEISK